MYSYMLTVKCQSRSKASCCQEREFTVLLFCRLLQYLDILCELDFNLPCCVCTAQSSAFYYFKYSHFCFAFLFSCTLTRSWGSLHRCFKKQCYHTWAISKNSIWWPVLFTGITLLLGVFFRAVSLLNARTAHYVTKSTWFCQHYQKQLCLCC